MGRTLDAVEHYADTPEVVIEPTETARAVFIENPPGADALKVLIALLDKAGPQIAEDVAHEIRLRELNARKVIDVQGNERGMRHHDQDAIRNVMNKLAVALLNLDEPGKQRLHIGTIVPQATIDYRDEASGDLVITWRFGAVFRKLAAESDLYTKLDAAALLAMRSRYAIALLRHCSTHFEKTKTAQQEFAVDHLRQVLGVPDGRHKNFHDLRRHALEPAIAEINATSRWTLEATSHKTGRSVTSVTISWTEKPLAEKTAAKAELDRHSAGRKQRQAGTAERIAEHPPLPTTRYDFRNSIWEQAYHDAGCRADVLKTLDGFREWTTKTGKPQTPTLFHNFCKGENRRKGNSMIDPNAAGNVTIVLDADEADELAQFLGYHTRVRDGVIPVRGHTVACELLFRVSKSIGKNFNDYTKDPDDDDGSGLGPGDDPTPDPF